MVLNVSNRNVVVNEGKKRPHARNEAKDKRVLPETRVQPLSPRQIISIERIRKVHGNTQAGDAGLGRT
jgi:hypothetical protein